MVGAVVAVINGIGVDVAICGVDVALAPMMTGVAVKMDGVLVGGKNGVGGLNGPGWIPQPLQDAVISSNRIAGIVFFISSPACHCTPHATSWVRKEVGSLGFAVINAKRDCQIPFMQANISF
jgi:hypothetical protein